MRAGSDDDFKHAVPVRVLGGELDFVTEADVVAVVAECDGVIVIHQMQKVIGFPAARNLQSQVDVAASIL